MQLSVIIVNYNVQFFLEQALKAVQVASQRLAVEIWVVDNHSSDESVALVREKFPKVKLIANQQNYGFSVANNQAIRQAIGKYILLLNPDTVVQEDTFDKCYAFMEAHPEAGALGVRMIDGSGRFLPESKRGFPSPSVAFYKTFGLSSFFPKSPIFNRYHLGHLGEFETNTVDVLAGAFMWMRKSVLDQVGLLDEQFFMYGEDIDLSYRLTLANYQNYYFPETTIIHYKGESTKKGSLNYVRTFYQAMILFAKKHFSGRQAYLFVLLLKIAIYFRAFLTLFGNAVQSLYLPFLDGILIFLGLVFLKDFWENYHFHDAFYYGPSLTYLNFPLYTLIWWLAIYFNGGYDRPNDLPRTIRGTLVGTFIIAAIYGFLPLEYRFSRALIVMGTVWAVAVALSNRLLIHFIKYKNLHIGKTKPKHLVIVGTWAESQRVQQLLQQVKAEKNFMGTVAPNQEQNEENYLSPIHQLEQVVEIYQVEEIIFCAQDVSAETIMEWMARLGSNITYKIVPAESHFIIGSSSKNTNGELYTIDIQYNINQKLQRRNKRLLDIGVALLFLASLPLHLVWTQHNSRFIKQIFQVLLGKKTWVGYATSNARYPQLPFIKAGVLHTASHLSMSLDADTLNRLNYFYAKDYTTSKDLEIIWKGYSKIIE